MLFDAPKLEEWHHLEVSHKTAFMFTAFVINSSLGCFCVRLRLHIQSGKKMREGKLLHAPVVLYIVLFVSSLLQMPSAGAHRLSSVSSHDSGFVSQDANTHSKPPSPMPSDITSQVVLSAAWLVSSQAETITSLSILAAGHEDTDTTHFLV